MQNLKADPVHAARIEAEELRLWNQIQAEQPREEDRPEIPQVGPAAAGDGYRDEARERQVDEPRREHNSENMHQGRMTEAFPRHR